MRRTTLCIVDKRCGEIQEVTFLSGCFLTVSGRLGIAAIRPLLRGHYGPYRITGTEDSATRTITISMPVLERETVAAFQVGLDGTPMRTLLRKGTINYVSIRHKHSTMRRVGVHRSTVNVPVSASVSTIGTTSHITGELLRACIIW